MNDTKQIIIDGALRLFSQNTFDGTSIREISKYTGINIAMISYYFGSKDGFLEHVIGEIHKRQKGLYQQLEYKNLNAYQRLKELIIINIDELVDNYFSVKLIFIESTINKRRSILNKMVGLTSYVRNYMSDKIHECNDNMKSNISSFFPAMFYSSLIDVMNRKLEDYNIDEINLYDSVNVKKRAMIKADLVNIYNDILDKVIS